jgi:hypothetical protein
MNLLINKIKFYQGIMLSCVIIFKIHVILDFFIHGVIIRFAHVNAISK